MENNVIVSIRGRDQRLEPDHTRSRRLLDLFASAFPSYKTFAYGDQLKMLSYNGVAPTEETLLSGEYPLVDGYYAVLRADEPQDSGARKLLAYLQGQDFAAAMAREGFFPVLGWYNS